MLLKQINTTGMPIISNNFSFKKAFIFSFLLMIGLTVKAQEKISLDEGWKFHFGNAANPEKDFDYSTISLFHKSNVFTTTVINPKFVDTSWTTVNVPHDWAVALPFQNTTSFDVESHGYKTIGGLYPES